MRILFIFFLSIGLLLVTGCSPVKNLATDAFQLNSFSTKQWVKKPHSVTLLVTAPEAVAGYQTQQMLYIKKPYQIEAFAKNEWASPPAEMLYPLLVQSLQRTGYFYAVASSLYTVEADYRLDSQILNLEQNFLSKPSKIDFTVKVVLTHVPDNKVIASRVFHQQIICPMDTPYGGVLAANKASFQLTAAVSDFVIAHVG